MVDYVVQRRFQTELMEKVGVGLSKVFEFIKEGSLHGCEALTILEAEKLIPKAKQREICSALLKIAKEEGDTETLSFEVVPWEKSILRGEKREAVEA